MKSAQWPRWSPEDLGTEIKFDSYGSAHVRYGRAGSYLSHRRFNAIQGFDFSVIGLTASAGRFYEGDIEDAGFTDFLIKLFAPKELLHKINLYTKEMATH